jgi:hypothetical protein
MSEALLSAADCCRPCPEDLVVNIPGPPGPDCVPCNDGAPGENAYTTLTNPFTMPGYGDSDTADVGNSDFMAVGQKVFIGRVDGAARGTFEVVNKVDSISVELLNVDDNASAYLDNSPPGTVFASASVVSPSGLQGPGGTVPGGVLLSVNNLADVSNVPASRVSLGLGTMAVQDANAVAITGGNIAVAAGGTGGNTALAGFNNISPLTTKGDLLTHDGVNNVRRAVGATANMVPKSDGAGNWVWALLSSVLGGSVSQLTDQVASGGTPEVQAYGAWTTLVLTASSDSPGNILSLVANQFVLRPGTYAVFGVFSPQQCYVRERLYNITGATSLLQSTQVRQLNNSSSIVPIIGVFTVLAAQTLEWQYYATNDGAGGGATIGYAMTTGDPEIFKSLTLLKIG